MLMDALRARRRHPPASHALAALTSPPASDRLAPAGLPAPLGSPAACGVRRAACGCHCGRSAPGGGDRPGFRAAAPAGLEPVQPCLQPGAVGRLDQEPRCRCGPAFGLGKSRLSRRSAWGSLSPADRIAKASEGSAERRLPLPRMCGGASTAGPASGVKPTATALRAGRTQESGLQLEPSPPGGKCFLCGVLTPAEGALP